MRHVLHCSSLIERCAVHPNPLSLCLQVTKPHPVDLSFGLLDQECLRGDRFHGRILTMNGCLFGNDIYTMMGSGPRVTLVLCDEFLVVVFA